MIFEKVKSILSEQLDLEEDTITMDSDIADDLGADSIDIVDMIMSLEDEFEIELPDEDMAKMAADEINQKWWDCTHPCFENKAFGDADYYFDMKQIFYNE